MKPRQAVSFSSVRHHAGPRSFALVVQSPEARVWVTRASSMVATSWTVLILAVAAETGLHIQHLRRFELTN